jgi:aspartyl-tRNA synthetase
MKSLKTKEIVVDVVMEVLVTQRFEVPADYQFDESEHVSAYLKLMNDHGSDKVNLTEMLEFDEIDAFEVCEVSFQGIGNVNVEEGVGNQVDSIS